MGTVTGIGGGIYDNGEILNIAEYIVSLAGKEKPRLVFLPTASFDICDEDNDALKTFVSLGCDCSVLKLTGAGLTYAEAERILLGADIIYADGGNLEFMMNTFNRTGASEILREAYKRGIILSGLSSGMMCWFAEGYDDCGEDGAFMFVDCLGILPYSACPHFQGGDWHTFEDAVRGRRYSGFAADNGAALVYRDGEFSVIYGNEGGRVYFFDKDKNHRKEIFGGIEPV